MYNGLKKHCQTVNLLLSTYRELELWGRGGVFSILRKFLRFGGGGPEGVWAPRFRLMCDVRQNQRNKSHL